MHGTQVLLLIQGATAAAAANAIKAPVHAGQGLFGCAIAGGAVNAATAQAGVGLVQLADWLES